jgi:O-antigen/teichoic acid export membrane protein
MKLNNFFFISLSLSAVTLISGFFSYFFQILLSNYLSVENFGTYNSLLSFSGFLGIPLSVFSVLLLKQYSYFYEKKKINNIRILFSYCVKISLTIALSLLFLFKIFENFLCDFLKISSKETYWYFVIMHLLGIFLPFFLYYLQSIRNFFNYSLLNISASFFRVFFTFIFLYIFANTLNVVFISLILTAIASLVLGFYFLSNCSIIPNFLFKKNEIKPKFSQINLRNYIKSGIVVLSFSLILQIDILIINYYFDKNLSGNYALASLFAKVIFFIPSGVNSLMLIELPGKYLMKKKISQYLNNSLIFITIFSLTFILFIYYFGPFLINYFYGDKFIIAQELIKFLPLVFFPYTLIQCFEYFLLGKNEITFSYIYIFLLPFFAYLLKLYSNNINNVILIIGLFGYVFLFLGLIIFIFKNRITNS